MESMDNQMGTTPVLFGRPVADLGTDPGGLSIGAQQVGEGLALEILTGPTSPPYRVMQLVS
jgi:hypothetical protein